MVPLDLICDDTSHRDSLSVLAKSLPLLPHGTDSFNAITGDGVLSKFPNESQVPGTVSLVPVEMSGRRSIRSDFLDVSRLGDGYHRAA